MPVHGIVRPMARQRHHEQAGQALEPIGVLPAARCDLAQRLAGGDLHVIVGRRDQHLEHLTRDGGIRETLFGEARIQRVALDRHGACRELRDADREDLCAFGLFATLRDHRRERADPEPLRVLVGSGRKSVELRGSVLVVGGQLTGGLGSKVERLAPDDIVVVGCGGCFDEAPRRRLLRDPQQLADRGGTAGGQVALRLLPRLLPLVGLRIATSQLRRIGLRRIRL